MLLGRYKKLTWDNNNNNNNNNNEPIGERPLRGPRLRLKGNIRMDLKEIGINRSN